MSCVLLILSSFFTRALHHTFHTEVTFDYAGMAVVDPAFYLHNYTPAQSRGMALDLAARMRQVPGIDAASIATFIALRRRGSSGLRPTALHECRRSVLFPDDAPALLQGRMFAPSEQGVVVISVSAAQRLWPNESPLGRAAHCTRTRTVTGVVKDSGVSLMSHPESVENATRRLRTRTPPLR